MKPWLLVEVPSGGTETRVVEITSTTSVPWKTKEAAWGCVSQLLVAKRQCFRSCFSAGS